MFRIKRRLRRRGTIRAAGVFAALFVMLAAVGVSATPAAAANPGDVWFTGMLRSMPTGRCLDSNYAGDVYTIPCNGGTYQQWRIVYWSTTESLLPWMTIQDVQTGRFLDGQTEYGSLRTTDSNIYGWTWMIFPPYAGNLSVYRFEMVSDGFPVNSVFYSNDCADANSPTDSTGSHPWLFPCGSGYQDWHMGF